MKISFIKDFIVIDKVEKVSAKGNKYNLLLAYDEDLNTVKLFVKDSLTEKVKNIAKGEPTVIKCAVTYGTGKADRLEVIDLV